MKSVLISGTNRGLGLEFCRQYAELGWQVIATCRKLEKAEVLKTLAKQYKNVHIYQLDIVERPSIDELVEELDEIKLDLLIGNAGVYGDEIGKGLGNLDYQRWITTLETNLLGVIKLVEAFLPQLRQSDNPHIAVLSSQMGSIEDNGSGGSLLYRSSKAALNASMKSVAIDLRDQGIGVQIFHPGWVKTDMGGPHALIDTETSVKGMIMQIKQFELSNTGQFIKYDGSLMPW